MSDLCEFTGHTIRQISVKKIYKQKVIQKEKNEKCFAIELKKARKSFFNHKFDNN